METVTCGACGTEVTADAVYCPACARPIATTAVNDVPEAGARSVGPAAAEKVPRLCSTSGCGQPLGESDAVCGYCGEPVAGAQQAVGTLAFPWGSHSLEDGESVELGRARPPFATSLAGYPNVGRAHARVARADGGLLVTDLGSTNGTYIDGRRLPPHVPTELRVGQVLRLAASLEIEIQ